MAKTTTKTKTARRGGMTAEQKARLDAYMADYRPPTVFDYHRLGRALRDALRLRKSLAKVNRRAVPGGIVGDLDHLADQLDKLHQLTRVECGA